MGKSFDNSLKFIYPDSIDSMSIAILIYSSLGNPTHITAQNIAEFLK